MPTRDVLPCRANRSSAENLLGGAFTLHFDDLRQHVPTLGRCFVIGGGSAACLVELARLAQLESAAESLPDGAGAEDGASG
jgi:hypothetical protein